MSTTTWRPKKKKRIRKLGFLARMADKDGRNVLKRRRTKGRTSLAVTLKHAHAG